MADAQGNDRYPGLASERELSMAEYLLTYFKRFYPYEGKLLTACWCFVGSPSCCP